MIVIGVLALQGAFEKHCQKIEGIAGVRSKQVRTHLDLASCDALVIPGGESTTISRHLQFTGLLEAILDFSLEKPIMGTCAGLILMSHKLMGSRQALFPLKNSLLKLIDVTVERNAYGRQLESFSSEIQLHCSGQKEKMMGIFIRAPKIHHMGAKVEVLASLRGQPVAVKEGKHLGMSFHPELTSDGDFFYRSLLDQVL